MAFSPTNRLITLFMSFAIGCGLLMYAYRVQADQAQVDLVETKTANILINASANIQQELQFRAKHGTARPIANSPTADDFPDQFPEEIAPLFYPGLKGTRTIYDPSVICRRPPFVSIRRKMNDAASNQWMVTTNEMGLSEDHPVDLLPMDFRAFVTGDSNIEGVCPNNASFANLTQALLQNQSPNKRVDVLNAGTGSTGPPCYLGWLEVFSGLDIDLHIAVVYGGNDFVDMAIATRWDRCLGRYKHGRLKHADYKDLELTYPSASGIAFTQIRYFANNPGDMELAVFGLSAMALEMQRRVRKRGGRLLCVYLPSPFTVRKPFRKLLNDFGKRKDLSFSELLPDEIMADKWLSFLRQRKIPFVDLRPALQNETAECYWPIDLHLGLHGHEVAANEISERITELFPELKP